MLALMARSEHSLNSKRISDCFEIHFFETNFWFEWCSLFAFERWHSAIEFCRYLLRFMHHFSTIDSQEGVFRTRYNRYDSMAVPLLNWLRAKGVVFRSRSKVIGLGFASGSDAITVNSLEYESEGSTTKVPIGACDLVFVTSGSMTAGKSFGTMASPPEKNLEGYRGAWQLWEAVAAGRPEFGNQPSSIITSNNPPGSRSLLPSTTQPSSTSCRPSAGARKAKAA